MELDEDSD